MTAPEFKAVTRDPMSDHLEVLVELALEEQTRINGLDEGKLAKVRACLAAANALDEHATHIGRAVTVVGKKIHAMPLLLADEAATKDTFDNLVPSLEDAVVAGESYGFGFRTVVDVDTGDTRMVVCHLVKVGESRTVWDKSYNEIITQEIAWLPVEDSTLLFEDTVYECDLDKVHQSEEPIYKDLRPVIENEGLSAAQRLNQIHLILRMQKFDAMEMAKKKEVASYLSKINILGPVLHLEGEYLLEDRHEDAPVSYFDLRPGYQWAVMKGFKVTQQLGIDRTATPRPSIQMEGHGLSLWVDLFNNDNQRVPACIPLNQPLKFSQ